jgi:hypothetical protein
VAPWAQKVLIALNFISHACGIAGIGRKLWKKEPLEKLDYIFIGCAAISLLKKRHLPTPRLITHTRQAETIMNSSSYEAVNKAHTKLRKNHVNRLFGCIVYFILSRSLLGTTRFLVESSVYRQFIQGVAQDLSPKPSQTPSKYNSFIKYLTPTLHHLLHADLFLYVVLASYIGLNSIRTAHDLKSHMDLIISLAGHFLNLLESLTSGYIMARLAHVTDIYTEALTAAEPNFSKPTTNVKSSWWTYTRQSLRYVPFITACAAFAFTLKRAYYFISLAYQRSFHIDNLEELLKEEHCAAPAA